MFAAKSGKAGPVYDMIHRVVQDDLRGTGLGSQMLAAFERTVSEMNTRLREKRRASGNEWKLDVASDIEFHVPQLSILRFVRKHGYTMQAPDPDTDYSNKFVDLAPASVEDYEQFESDYTKYAETDFYKRTGVLGESEATARFRIVKANISGVNDGYHSRDPLIVDTLKLEEGRLIKDYLYTYLQGNEIGGLSLAEYEERAEKKGDTALAAFIASLRTDEAYAEDMSTFGGISEYRIAEAEQKYGYTLKPESEMMVLPLDRDFATRNHPAHFLLNTYWRKRV
jgi:hypothetical protein